MKYSQTIGLIACLALVAVCFMPWCFIASKDIVITGMDAKGTVFGKPGLMNIIFSALLAILFLIPKIWAKRTNIFIGALNLAWAFRSYLMLTACDGGDCPEKKAGIFLMFALSAVILLMAFLPKIALPEDD